MPLIFKSEPVEVKEVVKTRVNEMTIKRAFRTPHLAKTMEKEGAQPPIPTNAIPVFNVGLKDLAEKGDLTSAAQKSWRYLLTQDEKVVASADAIVTKDNKPMFSHINEGPFVNGMVSAFAIANASDDVKKGPYEARLLSVPALYFVALWLVDTINKRDLVIPLEPTPPPFVANKVIPLKAMLAILQSQAKTALDAQKDITTLGA